MIVWDYYKDNDKNFPRAKNNTTALNRIAVCPAETINTFDTSNCKILADNFSQKYQGYNGPLLLSNSGIYIRGAPQNEGTHIYFLTLDGRLEYPGYVYKAGIGDISVSLNKMIVSPKYEFLSYVDLDDVSVLGDFQVHTPKRTGDSFWMTLPQNTE